MVVELMKIYIPVMNFEASGGVGTVPSEEEKKLAFPSPFEVETPPEIKGWDEWIPYYLKFQKPEEAKEAAMFWFWDSLHWDQPIKPLDPLYLVPVAITYNIPHTRFIVFPQVRGTLWRVLNGYTYIGGVPILDPREQERRMKYFKDRAYFYYQHWDELYKKWEEKIKKIRDELESLRLDVELPEVLDFDKDKIMRGEGPWPTPAWKLLNDFYRLKSLIFLAWETHFEMLNIGYAAYGAFMDLCKKLFPGIDTSIIPKMIAGVEFYFAKTQGELRRLAQLAIDLGVDHVIEQYRKPEDILAKMAESDAGRKWIKEYEETAKQWFNLWPSGLQWGLIPTWREDRTPVFDTIRNYIASIKAGVKEKSKEEIIRERDELVESFERAIRTEGEKRAFRELLSLAQKALIYVENHKWWVENWVMGIARIKLLDLGRTLTRYELIKEPEDIFYLTPAEVEDAIIDLYSAWAYDEKPVGRHYLPSVVAKRKELCAKLAEYKPLPGLGPVPPATDPFLEQLWGITRERVMDWLGVTKAPEKVTEIRGYPGAPGVAEGPAKVIFSSTELHKVERGDILVAPTTDPSWTTVFPVIAGCVTDIGGLMGHAAIVGREYGIPVVVGTGNATKVIKTGMRLRVDGNRGVVTILSS